MIDLRAELEMALAEVKESVKEKPRAIFRRIELDTASVSVTQLALRDRIRRFTMELEERGDTMEERYREFYVTDIAECQEALRLLSYPQAVQIYKEVGDNGHTEA